jgi:hypothetical protein
VSTEVLIDVALRSDVQKSTINTKNCQSGRSVLIPSLMKMISKKRCGISFIAFFILISVGFSSAFAGGTEVFAPKTRESAPSVNAELAIGPETDLYNLLSRMPINLSELRHSDLIEVKDQLNHWFLAKVIDVFKHGSLKNAVNIRYLGRFKITDTVRELEKNDRIRAIQFDSETRRTLKICEDHWEYIRNDEDDDDVLGIAKLMQIDQVRERKSIEEIRKQHRPFSIHSRIVKNLDEVRLNQFLIYVEKFNADGTLKLIPNRYLAKVVKTGSANSIYPTQWSIRIVGESPYGARWVPDPRSIELLSRSRKTRRLLNDTYNLTRRRHYREDDGDLRALLKYFRCRGDGLGR